MIQPSFFDQFFTETVFSVALFILVNAIFFFVFYKGEYLSKKTLRFYTLLFNTLYIFVIALIYLFFAPKTIDTRIVILPTKMETTKSSSAYRFAISEHIEHNLRNIHQENVIIHSYWWIYSILPDHVRHSDTVEKVARSLPEVFVIQPELNYANQMYTLTVPSKNHTFTYTFTEINKLIEITPQIMQDFLTRFDIKTEFDEPIVNYLDTTYTNALKLFHEKKYDVILDSYKQTEFTESNRHLNRIVAETLIYIGLQKRARKDLNNPHEKQTFATEFIQAKEILIHYFNADYRSIDFYFPLIRLFLIEEDYSEAEDLIQAFLTHFGESKEIRKTHPEMFKLYRFLHPSRYKKDGFSSEFQLIKETLSINPFDEISLESYIHALRRESFRQLSKKSPAIEFCKRYLKMNPFHDAIWFKLAELYIERGVYAQALDIFESKKPFYQNHAFIQYNLGIVYYNLSQANKQKDTIYFNNESFSHTSLLKKAQYYFEQAIDLENHLDAHLYLARIHDILEEKDLAIHYYRYRIRNRINENDEFYLEAAKGLRKLFESDTTLFIRYGKKEGFFK